MVLVDTKFLVHMLQNDPQWAEWSIAQLRAQAKLHALAINPVIYAEISLSFSALEALEDVALRALGCLGGPGVGPTHLLISRINVLRRPHFFG